jgi:hypothetical protein
MASVVMGADGIEEAGADYSPQSSSMRGASANLNRWPSTPSTTSIDRHSGHAKISVSSIPGSGMIKAAQTGHSPRFVISIVSIVPIGSILSSDIELSFLP